MSNESKPNESRKPFIEVRWRPLFKSVVKTGYVVVREVKSAGLGLYLQANQLVVEAKAELEEEDRKKSGLIVTGASD